MRLNQTIVFAFFLVVVFQACKNGEGTAPVEENGFVEVSKAQFESEQMQLGSMEKKVFEDIIRVSGKVVSPVGSVAEVNTHIPGMIKSIAPALGSYVTKGQVLCRLEGKEIIALQQQYRESSHELDGLRADYERIKALTKENISAGKELVSIESRYLSLKAKVEGLKAELQLLHLDAIEPGQSNLESGINILAPISGSVSKIQCVPGQYVMPENSLMQIVDMSRPEIHFSIFEKDLARVRVGQKIRFYQPDHPGLKMSASIRTVGSLVDPEDKTLVCTAIPDVIMSIPSASGMFVEIEVITGSKESFALPEEAIVGSEQHPMVFELKERGKDVFRFTRKEIKTGLVQGGYKEVTGVEGLKEVLIKGAFNLTSE